jgi:hypothetical protein
MKLFITNKNEMEEELISYQIDPKIVHSIAYHKLLNSIDVDWCIPLYLMIDYNEFHVINLTFVTTKNDIYFYNFKGIL